MSGALRSSPPTFKVGKAHVRIMLDAYAGCSVEEIERRKETARAVCERILRGDGRG